MSSNGIHDFDEDAFEALVRGLTPRRPSRIKSIIQVAFGLVALVAMAAALCWVTTVVLHAANIIDHSLGFFTSVFAGVVLMMWWTFMRFLAYCADN